MKLDWLRICEDGGMMQFPLFLGQADAAKPTVTAETPKDVTGEVDVSATPLFERFDNLVDGTVKLVPNIVIGIIVFALFFFASKIAARMLKKYLKGDRESLGMALARLARMIILILGFLVAAMIIAPSVKPADLLATLGVGGVAIGFAFKDILQNFLAGILLLVRQPF